MSVTDEIKSRLDIVNYIQQYVSLKKAGRNFKANCPFHNEKTPSFVVNPETQTWRCFGSCAEGGDIFSFAQKYHGWAFPEALEELGKLAGVQVHQQSAEQKQQTARLDELRGLMQTAADFYYEQLWHNEWTLDYARNRRGFTDETIQNYAIGYAPDGWRNTLDSLTQLGYAEDDLIEVGLARRSDSGRVYDYFRNRLVIPIRDERGRVIGFGARALADEDNPKYLNSPQTPLFDKSSVLFGLDVAKRAIRDEETAVIVEGYMDVIQAHQAGFMNVVAQMGTAMTEVQLKTLAPRWAKTIIMALDADSAGQNATMRSLEVAREVLKTDVTGKLAVDIRILQLPGAKDPDDLIRETPDEWPDLVSSAIPVAEYVIQMETAALPANASVQAREAVARRLLPILLASENNLYKRDNIQKLALKLHIGENDLMMWAAEQQRIQSSRPPRRVESPSPPDLPPLDYANAPPELDDEGMPVYTAPRPKPATRDSGRWEAVCLRGLLRDPDLIYQINRRLREVASFDSRLVDGPLCDFGVGDFLNVHYQTLVGVFLEALEQDDYDPVDYVNSHLEDMVKQILVDDMVLADDGELVGVSVRNRFAADRQDIFKRANGAGDRNQILKVALNMRLQRLKRESEELRFHIQEMGDAAFDSDFHRQYTISVRAFQLLDNELKSLGQTM